jgi:hypothetical protein
VEEAQHFSTLR